MFSNTALNTISPVKIVSVLSHDINSYSNSAVSVLVGSLGYGIVDPYIPLPSLTTLPSTINLYVYSLFVSSYTALNTISPVKIVSVLSHDTNLYECSLVSSLVGLLGYGIVDPYTPLPSLTTLPSDKNL